MQGCCAVSARSASAPHRFTEVFNGRARLSERAEVCQVA